jgi:hypothetical protein
MRISFRVARRGKCRFRSIKVLKGEQNNSFRGLTSNRHGPATACKKFSSTFLDDRFCTSRLVFSGVAVLVQHIDFADDVGGRLGLSMQYLDSSSAETNAG